MINVHTILRKIAPTNVEVASILGVHFSNLSNWRRDGHIPWKHRVGILKLAESKGIRAEMESLLLDEGRDSAA